MRRETEEQKEERLKHKERELKQDEALVKLEFDDEDEQSNEFIDPVLVQKIYNELGLDQNSIQRAMKGVRELNNAIIMTEKI